MAAESVLQDGETLSGFVEQFPGSSVEHRRSQQKFAARGQARLSSECFPVENVPRELVFGSTGYIALFEVGDNETVTILAVRYQRESD